MVCRLTKACCPDEDVPSAERVLPMANGVVTTAAAGIIDKLEKAAAVDKSPADNAESSAAAVEKTSAPKAEPASPAQPPADGSADAAELESADAADADPNA